MHEQTAKTIEFLQERVEHLEEINRQSLYAIDIVKAFAKLQRKMSVERDITTIQKASVKLFTGLIHFEACAFFMLQEDMLEFSVDYIDPPSFKDQLRQEIDEQIEAGTFSWALNQTKANIVDSRHLDPPRKLLLHPLATESRVLGMFAAVLSSDGNSFSTETLTLLSVILVSTSLAIENAILYQDLYQHNVNLNKLVEERTAEIRKLLGIAAHDLRNPLSAIRGFAELLNDGMCGKLNEEQKDLISTIYGTTDSLLHMVNDLLDVSVIESGEMNLEMALADLGALINEVVRLDRMTAERKGITINLSIDPLPDDLVFDHRKMRQVIDNLVSNAIKFSPRDTDIRVTARCVKDDVSITVKDQGPGIPENERGKLFETFGKTSVRPTGGETSTGLGLAICRRIVLGHGGRIEVDCPDGGGSEFRVVLNRGKLQEAARQSNEAAED